MFGGGIGGNAEESGCGGDGTCGCCGCCTEANKSGALFAEVVPKRCAVGLTVADGVGVAISDSFGLAVDESGGVFGLFAAIGGGGIVPTTGDVIVAGTMGTTGGGDAVVVIVGCTVPRAPTSAGLFCIGGLAVELPRF